MKGPTGEPAGTSVDCRRLHLCSVCFFLRLFVLLLVCCRLGCRWCVRVYNLCLLYICCKQLVVPETKEHRKNKIQAETMPVTELSCVISYSFVLTVYVNSCP
jgi:uncharacterized membrane protein